MNVLALMGSPRKQGNSDILGDRVLHGARDAGAKTDKIYLDDKRIRPIGEVFDNTRQRSDSRSDDDYPAILEEFLDSDIIVLATPVYWLGVSAQLKCFIDRLSSYFNSDRYKAKFCGKGYIVVTTFGRDDPEHGKWVTEPLKVCVDVLHGVYLGDLCVSVYQKGKVLEMGDQLEAAYQLGKQAVARMTGDG